MNNYLLENDSLYLEGETLTVEQLKAIIHYMDLKNLTKISVHTGRYVEEPK